ncbi:MAG: BTAD domain-containing putative transcriptional regulator [Candidatus Velthaea sp.]
MHIRCLGPFSINGINGFQLLPSFKKGRELVEYLAIYSAVFIPRERLLEAFWPGHRGDHLEHRLHLAASGARAMLRSVLNGFDAIACIGGGYGWHESVIIESDLRRFFECARARNVESAREGIELYAGEFLAGERADWISAMRAACASLYFSMLGCLALDAFAADDYQTTLGYTLQVIASDRGHEPAARLSMRCYAALGQRGAARAEYDALAKFLAAELGVLPSLETQNTLSAILNPNESRSTVQDDAWFSVGNAGSLDG